MATLYVENVPDELYQALRKRAKQNRKSIAGEVISLLEENVPTPDELKRRIYRLVALVELFDNEVAAFLDQVHVLPGYK